MKNRKVLRTTRPSHKVTIEAELRWLQRLLDLMPRWRALRASIEQGSERWLHVQVHESQYGPWYEVGRQGYWPCDLPELVRQMEWALGEEAKAA